MLNPMGNYTLEIGQILKHGGKIFDFDYPFYNPSHKEEFERKFLLHYRYHEIGQETLQRFKYMLQDTLTLNHEKYLHYWNTQQKAIELKWWNNKDYVEDVRRTLEMNKGTSTKSDSTNRGLAKNDGTSTFESESNIIDTSHNTNKFLDTPEGKMETIDDGYLTNITKDDGGGTSNNKSNATNNNKGTNSSEGESHSTSSTSGKDTDIEVYHKEEFGNIGVTSAGQLVQSWLNDAYFNIDKMIIDDCAELFMQVY